jgi:predicted lipid-binding transport protein (Tim44 family)
MDPRPSSKLRPRRFRHPATRASSRGMTIGTSIFLLAVGAILRYAVDDAIEGVDLPVIGLILMIAGVIGLIIGLWQTSRFSRRTAAAPAERVVERPVDPRDPRY